MAPARIGTHNGTFHCDEALACALLCLLPEYRVWASEPNAVPSDAHRSLSTTLPETHALEAQP